MTRARRRNFSTADIGIDRQNGGNTAPALFGGRKERFLGDSSSRIDGGETLTNSGSRGSATTDGNKSNPPMSPSMRIRGRTGQGFERSKKRKADSSVDSARPTQRPRHDNYGTSYIDEEFIRNTMPLPTADDYPKLPGGLLGDSIVPELHNFAQSRRIRLQKIVEFRRSGIRCHLKDENAEGQDVSAMGDGYNKVSCIRKNRITTCSFDNRKQP